MPWNLSRVTDLRMLILCWGIAGRMREMEIPFDTTSVVLDRFRSNRDLRNHQTMAITFEHDGIVIHQKRLIPGGQFARAQSSWGIHWSNQCSTRIQIIRVVLTPGFKISSHSIIATFTPW